LSEQDHVVHQPVLVDEVLECLQPEGGGIFIDLTVGGGGHAQALLERAPSDAVLYGLDRDREILQIAAGRLDQFGERCDLFHGNFSEVDVIFNELEKKAGGVLMDLGVSSLQLTRPERGFSFLNDGPLDMRMDPSTPVTAEDFINKAPREELYSALYHLGEEPRAKQVVEAILNERRKRPLLRTTDLKEIVEGVYKRRGGKIHPATRTFQGVRMAVNRELEHLSKGLAAAFGLLRPAGRLAVISFHSGEDRIVKEFLKARVRDGEADLLSKKVIRPTTRELRRNRRSRSARMRTARKKVVQ